MGEANHKIKLWMAGCLVVVALLVDLFQFLITLVAIGVFLAPIITVCASALFWIWFKLLGISIITNPKRLATFGIESVGELIPIVNTLPMWTLGTVITIIITRSEDKGGIIGKATAIAKPITNPKNKLPLSTSL